MKSLSYIIALEASFSMAACNNNKSNSEQDTTATAFSSATVARSAKSDADSKIPVSVKALVDNYLQLKNALAKDNSNDAATAGTTLADGFVKFDKSALTAAQKKII